jgi:carbamoyl-phosphate synthase large subunit
VTAGQVNILMTGGGAPGAAGILACLKKESSFNITLADANPQAVGRFLHHNFEQIPFAEDPAFIDQVISLCQRKKIDVVLPLVTKELIPLSSCIEDFALTGTRILISPAASLEIANNKSRLLEFLQWRGIDVPAFRIAENAEQFQKAAMELGYPEKKICFKPSVSNGSRGFRIIDDQANEKDLLFNYKPDSTFITMDNAVRILSMAPIPEMLVCEYLPGPEYSVDCLANKGETVVMIPRLRKKIVQGISIEGEFVDNKNIIAYCQKIVKELRLHGNIGIQLKGDENEKYLILEINPRVQGTIAAAMGAGINLPVLAVKQELGWKLSPQELQVKWGVKFSKYWSLTFY